MAYKMMTGGVKTYCEREGKVTGSGDLEASSGCGQEARKGQLDQRWSVHGE